MDLCWQSNVSAFSTLSRLVTAFLPKSKRLLISWLQSPSAVILEPPKIKSVTVSIVSPSICHEVVVLDAIILVFKCWVLSSPHQEFTSWKFTFIKRLFSSSSLSAMRVVLSEYLRLLIFLPAILIPLLAGILVLYSRHIYAKKGSCREFGIDIHTAIFKMDKQGPPWWSSSWDSMLLKQGWKFDSWSGNWDSTRSTARK